MMNLYSSGLIRVFQRVEGLRGHLLLFVFAGTLYLLSLQIFPDQERTK